MAHGGLIEAMTRPDAITYCLTFRLTKEFGELPIPDGEEAERRSCEAVAGNVWF